MEFALAWRKVGREGKGKGKKKKRKK